MHLILDTEASIDINEKMSTIEESSGILLNDGIETLKTAINNSNKENVQRQENIITNLEEETNGVDKEDINDDIDASLPIDDRKLHNNEKVKFNSDENSCTDVKLNGTIVAKDNDFQDLNIDTEVDNTEIVENTVNLENVDETIETEELEDLNTELAEISDSSLITHVSETEPSDIKEILECKDNIEENDITTKTKSAEIPNVSEPISATPMEVADKTEDIEKNKTMTNEDLIETVLAPKVEGLEGSVNVHCNVLTNDSSVDDEFALETDMEIDVSKPLEIERPNKVEMECDELVVNAVQNTMSGNEEVVLKTALSSSTDKILKHKTSIDEEPVIEHKSLNDEETTMNTIVLTEEATVLDNNSSIAERAAMNNTQIDKDEVMENMSVDDDVILQIDSSAEKDVTLEENVLFVEKKETPKKEDILGDITSSVGAELLEDKSSHEKAVLENTTSINEAEISKETSLVDGDAVLENKSLINDEKILDKSAPINTDVVIANTTTADIDDISQSTYPKDKEGVLETKSSISEEGNLDDVEKVIEVEDAKAKTALKEASLSLQEKSKPQKKLFSKLSNTLDILSDDEDDPCDTLSKEDESVNASLKETEPAKSIEKQCINIEDDDDIMLIDEDINRKKCSRDESVRQKTNQLLENKAEENSATTIDLENNIENVKSSKTPENVIPEVEKDIPSPKEILGTDVESKVEEQPKEEKLEKTIINKPLLPENFLKAYKKNLADMTRDDLEEFCILKIVESIVDRSNLSDIKTKMKEMTQNIEEHKKKAMMLTKQNRDLQVVLKSVQEEQKKIADNPSVIKPLKITRSVGMQVLMTEKPGMRKKPVGVAGNTNNLNNKNIRTPNQSPKLQKTPVVNQTIPVPRLVPANSPVSKISAPTIQNTPINTQAKTSNQTPNGVRNSPPVQKVAEKRPISRVQSVTVDLTDDEPPTKITPRSSPAPPVRLVSPQNLLAPRQAFGQTLNSPRKVYIPISGPQGQNIRPGPALMLKSVSAAGPGVRPRVPPPHLTRMPQNTVRMQARVQNRHPAPLPDAVKQYQPPNWRALPPAPDLKLSKVENGIVISWKIEGYQEDSYEEIASYQLYAYQETSSPPSTALWKKIGDVKALPLPMACTLTHVMAGYKYYFAVRAVDIRSRLGPFSLPGSILLLNKL